jgi:RHS repeat-associated protein
VFLWCWLVSTSFAALTLRDSTATAAPLNTGAWTATATSEFTVSVPLAAVTSTHDAEGNVTSRSFADGRVQTLTWDAFNRLVRVTERDSANNGYDWSALYDALGRRLRTTHQPVVANAASGTPTTIVSLYDPEREFLEIAVIVNGAVAWKVHGPDLNGTYGGWNGTGGLEAVLTPNPESANGGFVTKAVVSDAFGNVVATVTGMGPVQRAEWLSTRVGAYGPLPNHRPEILTSPLRLAEASAWRTRRVDPTGFYYLGARYYEPHSARFLSPDPLGHGSDLSLYAFANGDPVNRFDPDGRLAKGLTGGYKGQIGANDPNSWAYQLGLLLGGGPNGLVSAPGEVPRYWENAIVDPNAPGAGVIALIEGAGGGFQGSVINPIGTGAGLLIYDNVPGSVTVGGAYGYGGYVTVARDGDGRSSVVGAFGLGIGGKIEVSTNTPTLTNIQGMAPYIGVDAQGSTRAGAFDVGGGFGVYSSADSRGNYSTVVSANGAAEIKGTPLSVGGEVRGQLHGNVNQGTMDGRIGGETVGTAGAGAFIFVGAQGGVVFGSR